MKKYAQILVTLLVVFAFAGCEDKKDDSERLQQSQSRPLSEAVNTDGTPHATKSWTCPTCGKVFLVTGAGAPVHECLPIINQPR